MPYKSKPGARKYGENPLPQKSSGFKMKGSPMKRNFGIGADSPMKQSDTTTPTYSGVTFNPMSSYDYKASPDIPSFRDIVSLEQQQAYADKVDERRAKRAEKKEAKEWEKKKEAKEWEKKKEAGGGTLDELETKEEERRKEITEEPSTTEISGKQGEVKPENEINIGSNTNSYGI